MATSPRFFQQSLLVYPPHPSSSNNLCWYIRLTPVLPTIFVGIPASLRLFQQPLLEIYELSPYTNNVCWKFTGYICTPTILVGKRKAGALYQHKSLANKFHLIHSRHGNYLSKHIFFSPFWTNNALFTVCRRMLFVQSCLFPNCLDE